MSERVVNVQEALKAKGVTIDQKANMYYVDAHGSLCSRPRGTTWKDVDKVVLILDKVVTTDKQNLFFLKMTAEGPEIWKSERGQRKPAAAATPEPEKAESAA